MPNRLTPRRASQKPVYKRIVLKLSGEVLKGEDEVIDARVAGKIAAEVAEVHAMGVQVAVVIGGGNIWRGITSANRGMDRSTADYMGMLATIINGMALQEALEKAGINTRVQTAIEVKNVAEPFIRRRAVRHLEKGRVVILVAGTGNPFFTTDTAAALRASELGAEILLKATKVDGIYDSDPRKNPKAKRYTSLSYAEALEGRLQVMDSTAFALCMDNEVPIVVFDMFKSGNIRSVVLGEKIGTLVSSARDAKLKVMSIETLKQELANLETRDRHQIMAYLVALEDEHDSEYRAKMARKIDDKNPANWVTLEELEKRLGLGKHDQGE